MAKPHTFDPWRLLKAPSPPPIAPTNPNCQSLPLLFSCLSSTPFLQFHWLPTQIKIRATNCSTTHASMGSQILHGSRFLPSSSSSSASLRFTPLLSRATSFRRNANWLVTRRRSAAGSVVVASSSNAAWDTWLPDKAAKAPSLSDVVWPSLGSFAAMAMMGKIDQVFVQKGISITIAPLGAVCAVLFLTPSSPAAKKYNMFMAQIGCAAIGVLAFSILGPGWLARSVGLAASIAFMVLTQSTHPPAASLPLLFIDGAKMHHLNFWFALFPGAAACIILCLLQEVVCYLKNNFKF